MSSNYLAVVGPPPAINSTGWKSWYYKLLQQRYAECSFTRPTILYFSQAGNDATGNGTIGLPFRTIAKAQTELNSRGANVACLFRAGDTWEETTGLTLNQVGQMVGRYGTGAKPFFNRFTVKYTSSGWTVAVGDRYTRAEANDIAWVRDTANRLDLPYARVSSTALVESTPRSFFWSAGTLHLNAGVGVNPNTRNLEATITNTNNGILLTADLTFAQDIRLDGWGMSRVNSATQCEGLHSEPSPDESCLAVGIESYYCSSHTMAHYTAGDGGATTFINCRAGWANWNSSGETHYNSYSGTGKQEFLCHNCEVVAGTLPSSDWTFATSGVRGIGAYTHTGGGSNVGNIFSLYGLRIRSGTYATAVPYNAADLPVASELEAVRAFAVKIDQEEARGNAVFLVPFNMADVNSNYRVQPLDIATRTFSTAQMGGWLINGRVYVNGVNLTNTMSFVNGTDPLLNTLRYWNSYFDFYNFNSGGTFRFCFDLNANTPAEIKNCVVVRRDSATGTIQLFGANNATKIQGSAFFDITVSGGGGYDNGLSCVTLGSWLPDGQWPLGFPTTAGAIVPPLVGYDDEWQARSPSDASSGATSSNIIAAVPIPNIRPWPRK